MDHLGYFCLVLLYFHARPFVNALWSPAGKGLRPKKKKYVCLLFDENLKQGR